MIHHLSDLPDQSKLPKYLCHVRNDLITQGYAVVSSLLSQAECEDAIDSLWSFVEDTSGGMVQRTDASSWYSKDELVQVAEDDSPDSNHTTDREEQKETDYDDKDPWPHSGSSNTIDEFRSLGAGFVLGSIHEILAERLFEPIFGTRQLHTSKEGFTFSRPSVVDIPDGHNLASSRRYWKRRMANDSKQIAHDLDTCGQGEEEFCVIRSAVMLTDPTSSSDQMDILLKTGSSNTDPDQESSTNEVSIKPTVGDVIVFRSDVALVRNLSTSKTFHAVGYCSMSPSSFTPDFPKVWNEKLKAYKAGKTGDYRPFTESWYEHERRIEGSTTTCDEEGRVNWILARQRPFYRYSPPRVTKRLAQLYGLLSYDEDNDKEIERAVIRGVRFVDEVLAPRSASSNLCDARLKKLYLEGDKPLPGQDKYLGGVNSLCGRYIYGVPGTAKRVLRINTKTDEMDMIGPSFNGQFKWLRGVEVPPDVMGEKKDEYPYGCCLCLPCNSPNVLKINPASNEVTCFGEINEQGWLYHGGDVGADGYVYAVPANATRVAKIDPRQDTIEFIGPSFPGVQKWFGGIKCSDGCVYGIPHNATGMLKINPMTQTVSVLGEGTLPEGNWKWHGGTSICKGTKIIGYPNNADSVLIFDVIEQRLFTVGDATILQSGRHRIPQDRRYKYLGGAVTDDDAYTYLFPCDAERVLKIDNQSFELSLVGPELLEGENKYQNGFASSDGCIYGVPQRASGILRIVPQSRNAQGEVIEDHVDVLYCGDELVMCKDKFEGGVKDTQGNIICIPLRAKSCVKVIPGKSK